MEIMEDMETYPEIYLVSACLMGLCTRYDAKITSNTDCCQLLKNSILVPVCPEQLGGLPTPRPPADIHGGSGYDVLQGKAKVLTKSGEDVTPHFVHGAQQVLLLAQKLNIKKAYLKSRSPSCAVIEPMGVTAALLTQNNIECQEF